MCVRGVNLASDSTIFQLDFGTVLILWVFLFFIFFTSAFQIHLVSDLRQVGGFLRVIHFPPPTKLTVTI